MARFRFSLNNGESWVIVDDALPYTISATPTQEVLVEPLGSPIVVTAQLTAAFGELLPSYFSSFNSGALPEAFRIDATPEQKAKIFYEVPPPPRVGPVEPSVSLDLYGEPIFAPMTSSDNDRTLDSELDFRLEGIHPTDPARHAVSGGVFYSNFSKLTGARRLLLRRWDTKGFPFTISRPEDCTTEGIRGDFTFTADADFMLFNGQPDILKVKPHFRAARHTSVGQHGTNADGYLRLNSPNYMPTPGDPSSGKAKRTASSIEHGLDGLTKVTLSSAFADKLSSAGAALTPARNVLGSVPTLPDFFTISDSTTNGQVNTLSDANWRFDVLSAYTTSGIGQNSGSGTITVTGNYNAPIYTLGGTFIAGNKIDLFIAGTRFTYTVVTGSTSLGNIATALRTLIAADGRFSGTTVVSNVITVASSGLPAPTVFWTRAYPGHNIDFSDTVTGGTVWWTTQYLIPGITASSNRTRGTHADGIQWAHATGTDQPIYQAYVMIDQCTWEGNYDGLVFANSAASDCPLQFTRSNYRWKSSSPDDTSSGSFRMGHTGGVGLIEKRIYEVYNEPRPRDGVGTGLGFTADGKDANGIPDGTTVMSNGIEIGYASARPEMKGVVKRGLPPGGDFSPYATNGENYVHPGYSDFSEFEGEITDITFAGLTSINESTASNTTIGLIDVVTTNKAGDIDLSIVSTNVSTRNWFLHGRRLVAGITKYDYGSTPEVLGVRTATVTIRATLRGSSPTVSFDKTFSWPIVDDVAPAGAALAVNSTANVVLAAPTSGTNVLNIGTGTASAGRRVLFFASALIATASRELPLTIPVTGATGGTAQRLLRKRTPLTSNPTANIALMGAYLAQIDTGVASDVSLSVGGSSSAMGLGAIAINNLTSNTPFSSAMADNGVSGGSVEFEIDVQANGLVAIGAYYSTPTSGNKRHAALVFSRATAGTCKIRGTVTAGSSGPIVWEMETAPSVWTVINSGFSGYVSNYDVQIEAGGSGGTSVVALSFGNGFV